MVKVLMVNGMGIVLGVIKSTTADEILVSEPVHLLMDQGQEIDMAPYMINFSSEKVHKFMKYNIISISDANEFMSNEYKAMIDSMNAEKQSDIIVPDNKIITQL